MFKRKVSIYVIFILILITLFFPAQIVFATVNQYDAAEVAKIMEGTDVFNLKSKSAILMDASTGNILLESNSREKRPIASITKVMSMILVMEAIENGKLAFDDMVSVSEYAYGFGGSQVYLKPGEEFTVHEMMKAVAIHSANDATVALAEKIAGSEEAFVAMMNEKAEALGLSDTHFIDCSGLATEGHYSTAYDVAIMSREVVNKYPKILEYTKIWHDTFRNGEFSLDNTNKLIRHYPGTVGLKTGYISAAGYCLSAVVKRDNLTLISVVLGAPDSNTRFAESRKLLDYGFANFETTKLEEKNTEIGIIEVRKGLKTSVRALLADDVVVLLKKGTKQQIERHSNIEPFLIAPIQEGQKVGEVIYKLEGQEIARVDIIAEESIEKASFIKLFLRMILEWFGIGKNKSNRF
ncbi:MAG: D-alanyl-D-alanine carboxypeptidase [Firmicutes bacterium]|nr:D-alanyl-D-alanine carboxypeptidase [Bacillota bacterium]